MKHIDIRTKDENKKNATVESLKKVLYSQSEFEEEYYLLLSSEIKPCYLIQLLFKSEDVFQIKKCKYFLHTNSDTTLLDRWDYCVSWNHPHYKFIYFNQPEKIRLSNNRFHIEEIKNFIDSLWGFPDRMERIDTGFDPELWEFRGQKEKKEIIISKYRNEADSDWFFLNMQKLIFLCEITEYQ